MTELRVAAIEAGVVAAQIRTADAEARAAAAERSRRSAEAEPEMLEALDEAALRALENRLRAAGERVYNTIRERRLCVVCMERDKAYAPPCRHMCLCATCARDQPPSECPMCRAEVPPGGWGQVFH